MERPLIRNAQDSQTPSNLDWWHAAWLAGLALGAGLMLAAPILMTGGALAAIGMAAVPAALGLWLSRLKIAEAEPVILIGWGLGGLGAALLTGGLSGPLGVWLLAPLAAASAMNQPRRLALGVVIALAAVAAAILLGLSFRLPPPPVAGLAAALGGLGLITTGLGLGTALVLLQRRVGLDSRRSLMSEQGLRDILDQQPDLLVQVYPSGRLAGAWGRGPAVLTGKVALQQPLALLAAADDRPAVEAAVDQAVREGGARLRFRPPGGSGEANLELHLHRAGPTRLIGVIQDVRTQLAREAELEDARATAEAQNLGKSRFLANMSHELRTPLNAIMGFADIMQQKLFGPLPDRYADYPNLIHESGGHLLELINDVLDMSKIEADRYELYREEFDACDAVNAVLRLMRGQADRAAVSLRGLVPREPIEVVADRRALKQIVLNLISNALKFTPKGGIVTVTIRADGPDLELIVADTGVGISAEDLTRLGRPYEQVGDNDRRSGGTGLGLALVKAFAGLHDGGMGIESRVGEGTTVTVRLPVMLSETDVQA